ncbi:MAG: Gfo/Idh/MocA family oxidoreductase [Propionibacteriaceae bacterium]|jgi:myo-inositol 2-dehydrogenase/D-chiro-inositol 1-dehydrogenase|nr:Gfo/Idh/MocA family oxidoreductase [Propionibacteriaceae bacterium]
MSKQVKIGLIGAGRIGQSHGEILALHTPGAKLTAIADPAPGAAASLAARLGLSQAFTSPDELLASGVDAVVVAASATVHAELIAQAAAAGKAIFCEKPAALSVAELDPALAAVERAGAVLQIGFNRRFAPGFAAARAAVDNGQLGAVRLLRSNTRDPGLANPGAVPPWTIFTQTLIHDFDTLNWLNPGAEPIRVFAQADALVAPDFKAKGLLDTALVTIAYSNGALAMADACFEAVYGYDVRGEVFGSSGLAKAGHIRVTDLDRYAADGMHVDTARSDTGLLQDSYRGELAAFVKAVRSGRTTGATGEDARRALAIAEACIASYQSGQPVEL